MSHAVTPGEPCQPCYDTSHADMARLLRHRPLQVYRTCLKLIPHQQFTFAKMWVLAAQLEVRQRRLDAARKILGMAIGLAPKDKIFKSYIEMEFTMGEGAAAAAGLPPAACCCWACCWVCALLAAQTAQALHAKDHHKPCTAHST